MMKTSSKAKPFVGAGHVYSSTIPHPHGGFGTFFNREAIQNMVRPMFCPLQDEGSNRFESACANLQQNRSGELDVFQQGDSVFDLFYKFSALRDLCMHSDWITGYMSTYYLHPEGSSESVEILEMPGRNSLRCTKSSGTCHWQTPNDMKRLTRNMLMIGDEKSGNSNVSAWSD